jgi:hypothetical protein
MLDLATSTPTPDATIREELDDVGLEVIRVSSQQLLGAVEGAVRAFAFPTGKALREEPPLVERFQHVHDRVMHHAVPERRSADLAFLRVEHVEVAVGARLIHYTACRVWSPQRSSEFG